MVYYYLAVVHLISTVLLKRDWSPGGYRFTVSLSM